MITNSLVPLLIIRNKINKDKKLKDAQLIRAMQTK